MDWRSMEPFLRSACASGLRNRTGRAAVDAVYTVDEASLTVVPEIPNDTSYVGRAALASTWLARMRVYRCHFRASRIGSSESATWHPVPRRQIAPSARPGARDAARGSLSGAAKLWGSAVHETRKRRLRISDWEEKSYAAIEVVGEWKGRGGMEEEESRVV
ncbi:hypothetical protein AXG93_2016s1020 [Marchantia polymorpha subsp. ruderalis]|uniref:Uncharacterized protein n=1 Tax=Marchantia polymorpha subsp. ruderalis TaxID=1480154 RepID=A0A176VV58_MARPO|nr:hypothetical protein AXG93_2016s1020 [Marchantia polymorpha subsp. ruderalis]